MDIMKRDNRGVTLITLIITIIVMFILIGISINVVINSKLFESAKNASKKTEEAYKDESEFGDVININGATYHSLEEYANNPVDEEIVDPENPTGGWGGWHVEKEATCTEEGLQKRTCTICGQEEFNTIEPLGHNFENGVCTRCGTAE